MAFDPDSPTFYGECLPVEIGRDVTGTAIATKYTGAAGGGQAVTYLYDDDDTQTADAGDSILFGIYPEWTYLERDSEAVFTAVVELAAGSSGTFRLSAGVDPDWDLSSEALCTEVLGIFTAPGQARVLAPIESSYTVPLIYDQDVEPLLFLEVITGTVVIRQIRVRMWPPGGAAGAWTPDPDFTRELAPTFMKSSGSDNVIRDATVPTPQALGTAGPQAGAYGPGLWGGFDDYGDTAAAFAEMTAALSDASIPTYQAFEDSSSGFFDRSIKGSFGFSWTLRSLGTPGHDWGGGYGFAMAIIAFRPNRQVFRDGGLTYNDPDRIPWEDASAVRDGTTGGTLLSDFGGWTALPQLGAAPEANDAFFSARVISLGEEPDWDGYEGTFVSSAFNQGWFEAAGFSRGGLSELGTGTGDIPIPDVPVVGIQIEPLFILSPPSDFTILEFESAGIGIGDFAQGERSITYGTTLALHVFDNVEYFDPALPRPAERPEPRFFVKTLAGRMAPVGFGKPPEETTEFHVQTAQGLYRDLSTAEYDSLLES